MKLQKLCKRQGAAMQLQDILTYPYTAFVKLFMETCTKIVNKQQQALPQ